MTLYTETAKMSSANYRKALYFTVYFLEMLPPLSHFAHSALTSNIKF